MRSRQFITAMTFFALALAGASAAHAQLALGLGSNMNDEGHAVAVDADGNMYITGFFNGTVDFDPGPGVFELTTVLVESVSVACYDPAGALRYALSFKGEGSDIAVDTEGNVFVTGLLGSGGADVDPGPDEVVLNWQEGKVFLVSYDPLGNLRFGFNFGGGISNQLELGRSLSLDDLGNVYLAGTFNDDADFDPTTGEEIVEVEGNVDGFLASYDNSGGLRFAFGLGSVFGDESFAVDVAADGTSYVTGVFRAAIDFDPGPDVEIRTPVGNRDMFVASYSSIGGFRFASAINGPNDIVGEDIAVDAAGNSFVTGFFSAEADFDPGPGELLITSAGGGTDAFLASYDDNGDLRFAFRLGNLNGDVGNGIALDPQGRPHITGQFTNSVDFDPGPAEFLLSGTFNTFVAGYSSAGDFLFAHQFPEVGTLYSDWGRGIVVDSSQQIYVIGTFSGTNDFDPGPGEQLLTSNGSGDIYLTRNVVAISAVELDPIQLAASTITAPQPNPTSGRTELRLAAKESGPVRVAVYDVAGRLVAQLHDGFLAAGAGRTLEFAGDRVSSGMYFVRVDDRRGSRVQKVLVVR